MSGEVKMVHPVVCQKWEESERGWGTRPDGYSLHLSDTDREAFIKDYWAGMPNAVPDEYSRPDGTPYVCDADSETYKKIKVSMAFGVMGERPARVARTDGSHARARCG